MLNFRGLFKLCPALLIFSLYSTAIHAEETQDVSTSDETETASTQNLYQQELQEKIKQAREAARQQTEQQLQEQQAFQQQRVEALTQPKPTTNAEYIRIESPKPAESIPIQTTNATETKNSGGFPFFFIIAFGILGFIGWKLFKNSQQPKTRKRNRPAYQSPTTSEHTTQTQQQDQQRTQNSSSQQHNEQHSSNTHSTQQQAPLQTSDRVKTILEDYFSEKPHIPMAYRQQLNDINLDFSAESLHRLDQVLSLIKKQTQPDYARYCEELPYQQFVIFCGIYLATTIARVTHQSIKWFSYEEMKAFTQRAEFPQTLSTFVSCMIGNMFQHLPIEVICDGLFTDPVEATCQERLSFYQQHAKPLLLMSEENKKLPVEAQSEAEQAWVEAIKAAGFLAHHSLYMIENGSQLIPTLIQSNGEQKLLQSLIGDNSSQQGHEMLATNLNQFKRQAFVEDIYANLPIERIDALSIHVRAYEPHAGQWVIVLPYQHHDQGFEFYTPLSSGSSTPVELNPLLFKAFWQGFDDFTSPTNTRQYYVASKQLI
ncbi:hypothetical protein [Acinetobacter sp. NIPH 2699]|uniref:hypothetical protein n=1 Tax=Acinetobacter sp. NIPH 2699 TaxID=2923433 RepID=UPI001F4BB367|nr:hypothetical protein [Acinetobacter sp. NIPH 2699]MCH7336694.1 hypothetical protein [Acinetobacter sp. NIPH 2699]